MISLLPRIEISLPIIQQNCQVLCDSLQQRGLTVTGVSKAVQGDPSIAAALVSGGAKTIADSRLENINRMRQAGVQATFMLLRSCPSQAAETVRLADVSLNTELSTIRELSRHAVQQNTEHRFVVMVELGDLREGVLPEDLIEFVRSTHDLPNIHLSGLGTNLACFRGAPPDDHNMRQLSELVGVIEGEIGAGLDIVTGGNSANLCWLQSTNDAQRINSLRLGEAILLGRETLEGNPIDGLDQRAFQVVAEVIESNVKPPVAIEHAGRNAFGETLAFAAEEQNGERAILAIGRQDVLVAGLRSVRGFQTLGSSSDHMILNTNGNHLSVGDEVRFDVDYGALISAMASQYIAKSYTYGR